jgi:hypothetical protein
MFLGIERGRCLRLTTLPPSESRLSRQCGIVNISQPYRSPKPVAGIALLYVTLLYSTIIIITRKSSLPLVSTGTRGYHSVRYEYWHLVVYIVPCSPYVNRRFGATYHLHGAIYQKMATLIIKIKWILDKQIGGGGLDSWGSGHEARASCVPDNGHLVSMEWGYLLVCFSRTGKLEAEHPAVHISGSLYGPWAQLKGKRFL